MLYYNDLDNNDYGDDYGYSCDYDDVFDAMGADERAAYAKIDKQLKEDIKTLDK